MPPVRKLVVLVVGTFMAADGTEARPSVATIAECAGVGERAVKGHLAAAIEAGYLERVRRGHRNWQGHASASVYRATLPATCTDVHLADSDATCTGVHLDGSATCTSVHCKVHVDALQGAPGCTPPEPFDHSTTTTAAAADPIERQARTELADKIRKGEAIDKPEGWIRWRTSQLRDEHRRRDADRLHAAANLGRSRIGILDENDVAEDLRLKFRGDPLAIEAGLAAYREGASP
jgi:hypothetical protein